MTEKKDYSYLIDIINFETENNKENISTNVKFEGDFFSDNDVAKVNKNLSNIFIKDSSYNLSISVKDRINKFDFIYDTLKDYIDKTLEDEELTITHYSKYTFMLPKKHWIVYINWEYGSLPVQWIEPLSDYVDEIWVSSEYMKTCFSDSKIDDDKIKIVNSGVDPLYFNPNISTNIVLQTDKKVKFLYKGNTDWNSGLDILLKAYLSEFTVDDDVCLVLCIDKINLNKNINAIIEKSYEDENSPEIIIFDSNMIPVEENIYKTSHFFVSTKRADNYCLEILEAMASGIPVITNDIGACRDYCNEYNSIIVKSDIIFENKKEIKGIKTVSFPFWIESQINDLRVKLRKAFDMNKDDYKKLSQKASKDILSKYTWIKINSHIKSLISSLKEKPIKKDVQQEMNLKILDAIKSMSSNNFEKAYQLLKEAYTGNEKNPNLNFYLANLLMRNQDFKSALKHILISLKNNPDNEDYNNITGILLYKLGLYSISKKFFEKTLEIMPEHEGAFISLKTIEDLGSIQDNKIDEDIKFIIYELNIILKDFRYSKPPTLSVCIIAKDEEKYIEKCIRSVKNIADEIIVLDTGSTDNTIKIAKREGAIVYNTTWENDFAKARNQCIEKATKDWILMLDGDEALSKESQKRLKPTLIGLSKDLIYSPKIRNITNNKDSLEEVYHFVVRLIPNHKNIKYTRPIHEFPVSENGEKIPSSTLTGIEIIHYGYNPEIIGKKNKLERNINILNDLIKKAPGDPLNYYYVSNMFLSQGNYEEAEKNSKRAYELLELKKDKTLDDIKVLSQINLLASLIFQEKNQEAKELFEKFKSDLSKRPDYWFLYANVEISLGNYDKCIEYCHNALNLRGENIYPSVDAGTITWKPLYLIAKAYSDIKNKSKAIEYYKKAIKENPENILLYLNLTSLYIEQKDFKSIEKILHKFINKLSKTDISKLIKELSSIYLQENKHEHFIKLLEIIRKELLSSKAIKPDDYILADSVLDIYYKILDKFENKLPIKYSIACIKSYINENEKAKTLFNEILKENENDVDTICNLASISLSNNELDSSELLYQKAISIDEKNINALEGLTKVEILRNNLDKASYYIDKIKEIAPENPIIKDLEFEIINKKGDKKLASDMYASMIFNISMN